MFDNFLFYIYIFLGFVFSLILIIRNSIVFKYRERALDLIYEGETLEPNLRKYYFLSSTEMIWDLRKWTFKQFYPHLVKDETK